MASRVTRPGVRKASAKRAAYKKTKKKLQTKKKPVAAAVTRLVDPAIAMAIDMENRVHLLQAMGTSGHFRESKQKNTWLIQHQKLRRLKSTYLRQYKDRYLRASRDVQSRRDAEQHLRTIIEVGFRRAVEKYSHRVPTLSGRQ